MNIPLIVRDIWISASPNKVMRYYFDILHGRLDLSDFSEYKDPVSIWIAWLPGFCNKTGFNFSAPPLPACARQWLNDSGFTCINQYNEGSIVSVSIEWANPNQ